MTDPVDSGNPLFTAGALPDFGAILPEHVEPALRQTLRAQRGRLEALERAREPTIGWLEELEGIRENLHRVWGPVSHLNSVASTPRLREAFNTCLLLVTEFDTEMAQSEALYHHLTELEQRVDDSHGPERRLISQALRDLRLAGVGLPPAERARFRQLTSTLADVAARFEQNLMDATDAFSYHEPDRAALAGLPDLILQRASRTAREKGLTGWLLTLDAPTYQAVLSHAESVSLRARYYEAWVTRASAHTVQGARWDNAPLIDDMLALRHEAAQLLGFDDYAGLSLATKMARSADDVIGFLRDLAARSRPQARAELEMLSDYAGRKLAPWDVSYYAEKLRQERFGLSQEELRPYFPLPRVLTGLFGVAQRLFGIKISRETDGNYWHEDVEAYRIDDAAGTQIGAFLTDLYARPNKRGGAWMDVGRNRARLSGHLQLPIAYLVCNFNPPEDSQPALLTHADVVTLFHEFGHSLHHLLTEVEYPSIGGINGVAWDAVELPSQFLENFAWLGDVLSGIAHHYRSGEPLPASKIDALTGSRTFLSGLAMVRQLEFALFDFELHHRAAPAAGQDVLDVLARVRADVAVIDAPAFDRFPNSFAHIFGGGYAAGYYSYKWAEVLAADAFAAFEESGVFDEPTARRFRRAILSVGALRDAADAFIDFRGRPPRLEPLLRQSGIAVGVNRHP
jgi:oligopeptidase A